MSNVNGNDIDDLFKRAADGYPLRTNSSDWDRLAADLEKDPSLILPPLHTETDRPRRRRFFWLFLLLPLGGLGYLAWQAGWGGAHTAATQAPVVSEARKSPSVQDDGAAKPAVGASTPEDKKYEKKTAGTIDKTADRIKSPDGVDADRKVNNRPKDAADRRTAKSAKTDGGGTDVKRGKATADATSRKAQEELTKKKGKIHEGLTATNEKTEVSAIDKKKGMTRGGLKTKSGKIDGGLTATNGKINEDGTDVKNGKINGKMTATNGKIGGGRTGARSGTINDGTVDRTRGTINDGMVDRTRGTTYNGQAGRNGEKTYDGPADTKDEAPGRQVANVPGNGRPISGPTPDAKNSPLTTGRAGMGGNYAVNIPVKADGGQAAVSLKENAPKIKIQKARPSFYVGLLAAPDLSSVKFQSVKGTGTTYGVLLGYSWNQRWAVETGLYVDRKKYYTAGEYYDKKGNPRLANITLLKLDGICNMLEIPINVRYNLGHGEKTKWFATAGLSTYLMTKEYYAFHAVYTSGGNPWDGSWTYHTPSQNWFSIINLSIGYEQKLGRIGNLRLEPYLRVPLSGMGTGSLPIMSAGLNIGITRKIW